MDLENTILNEVSQKDIYNHALTHKVAFKHKAKKNQPTWSQSQINQTTERILKETYIDLSTQEGEKDKIS